jgi:hypothetical protein
MSSTPAQRVKATVDAIANSDFLAKTRTGIHAPQKIAAT